MSNKKTIYLRSRRKYKNQSIQIQARLQVGEAFHVYRGVRVSTPRKFLIKLQVTLLFL